MNTAQVDQDECIACESCVQICPEAFHMNDDGKAEFTPAGTGAECIQEAIDTCPVECIHWID
jgi:ferredoxin